jgi:hypothetical protein
MVADEVSVQAVYEEWFRLAHLSMEPGLAGAEHIFPFEDRELTVRLPSLPIGDRFDEDATAFISVRRTATNEPRQVEIFAVLVVISGLEFRISRAAASLPHIDTSLYTDEQQKELDTRSDKLWLLARRAIDYWLRVVRYHTGFARIGLDTYPGDTTLKGGQLINCERHTQFYTPLIQRTIVARGSHRLTPDKWKKIESSLKDAVSPPIWHEYLMSGRQRIEVGDLKAAVIDLATCSELAIRRQINTKLPADTPAGVREIVSRTNMTDIFRRWEGLGLPDKTSIPNFPTVRTLFDVRNAIAHRGEDDRVNVEFCKQASTAVQSLVHNFSPM